MGNGPIQGMPGRLKDVRELLTVGKLAGAGILTVGRIFIAKKADDRDHREFVAAVPSTQRFSTIQLAVAKCRSGCHDYVLVCPDDGHSGWAETEDIDLLGRYVHLVGLGAGGGRPWIVFSDDHKIDIGNGALTGDQTRGVEVANLDIYGGGISHVQCILNGDSNGFTYDTWIHDCLIQNGGTTAAVAEIQDYGGDLLVERCMIGRPNTHCDDNYKQLAGAGPATFRDCTFLHFAHAAGDQFATIVATGIPVIFKDCVFINANVSSQAMTTGVIAAAGAEVLLQNCGMVGAGLAGTTANVWVVPWVWNAAGLDEGVNICLAGDGALKPPQT